MLNIQKRTVSFRLPSHPSTRRNLLVTLLSSHRIRRSGHQNGPFLRRTADDGSGMNRGLVMNPKCRCSGIKQGFSRDSAGIDGPFDWAHFLRKCRKYQSNHKTLMAKPGPMYSLAINYKKWWSPKPYNRDSAGIDGPFDWAHFFRRCRID